MIEFTPFMQLTNTLSPARWIELPKIGDPSRGFLTFGEAERTVPFPIKRAYWIYGAGDPAVSRGAHAHREVEQAFFTLSGSVEVLVDWAKPGVPAEQYVPTPNRGLYLPAMAWHVMRNFAAHTIILVLASGYHDEAEYIRDRAEYERLVAPLRSR